VLVVAAALRAVVILGYPPIFWFNDSYNYVIDAVTRTPDVVRSNGYPFFLQAIEPFHSLLLLATLQAMMGLAMGLAIYAVLRRRGLPWWGATLCALPVLFDVFELQLEHMIMSDVLFYFLITMAIVALCWSDRPSWATCVVVGLVIGFIGAVMGIGGGFILIPIMIYLLRVPTSTVIGTSMVLTLVTMVFATMLHAVTNHLVDAVLALILMVGGVTGAQFGARAGQKIRGEHLRLLLGLLILAVGIRFAVELVIRPDDLFTIREAGGAG